MPTAGGVLNIVSGVFGIIGGLFMLLFGAFIQQAMDDYYMEPGYYELPVAFWWFLGFLILILSVAALVGGILAVQRKSWGLSLCGSIASILMGGNIFGILSTVFIALSRKDFTS